MFLPTPTRITGSRMFIVMKPRNSLTALAENVFHQSKCRPAACPFIEDDPLVSGFLLELTVWEGIIKPCVTLQKRGLGEPGAKNTAIAQSNKLSISNLGIVFYQYPWNWPTFSNLQGR